ncbi:hypothetical protein M9H77_11766 [Catharanthus roseus]|uniref:Uncharacterized protein n=1 Tax=Catharanthus roseus TaxID=4058 RepID=A0ACC0BFL0_CATRO|nr:hypothetical protein M9H77_11766 [Catharanthus roseus]
MLDSYTPDIIPFPEYLSTEARKWGNPNFRNFRSIKKTTQTGKGVSSLWPDEDEGSEDDESYYLSGEDEPSTGPIAAFQTEKWTIFEQFHVTQEIHGEQLAKIVESTRHASHVRVYLFLYWFGPHIEDNKFIQGASHLINEQR